MAPRRPVPARTPQPPPLVLASSSPRRAHLLTHLGITFEIEAPDVDESALVGEPPGAYVRRLALCKAKAVHRPTAVVVAADTTVVLDGSIVGKPASESDARRMLEAMSGRRHEVLTGIAVAAPGDEALADVVTSTVEFADLSGEDIDWYVGTAEPFDKAGGYGIQGRGALLVRRIQGSYDNVVGLPVAAVDALLGRTGRRLRDWM